MLESQESREAMWAHIASVSRNLDCPALDVGGVADHVHILVRFGKQVCLSDWIKEVKRVSSGFGKSYYPGFSWQSGYAAFSVGHTSLDAVRGYVRNQESHHAK